VQPYFYVTGNALWGCAPRGEVNNALHTASGSLPRQAQVCGRRTLYSVAGNVPQAAAPGEGILHVGFFMFGNVQKKLDG